MEHFAVLQTNFCDIPQDLLEHVLVNHGQMTRPDAALEVRVARGVLAEPLSKACASAVAEELDRLGYGAQYVSLANLSSLDEPRVIRWFELNEGSLGIPDGIRGDTVKLLWGSVMVVSSAFEAEDAKDKNRSLQKMVFHASGMVEKRTDHREKFRQKSRLAEVLDLIGVDENGQLQHLRMPIHQLSYARILGKATELTRFERFVSIARFVVERSAHAIISPATKQFLSNPAPSRRQLSGASAHRILEESQERYLRWLFYRSVSVGA